MADAQMYQRSSMTLLTIEAGRFVDSTRDDVGHKDFACIPGTSLVGGATDVLPTVGHMNYVITYKWKYQ